MLYIVVTKRSHDWHACRAGDPAVWEAGRTKAEAIGKLIISLTSQGLSADSIRLEER